MKYEKPEVDIVLFDNKKVFMTSSSVQYDSAQAALAAACGGYDGGKTNNFSCSNFGGYNEANPPTQHSQVVLAGGVYVFDYVGNHWKLEK